MYYNFGTLLVPTAERQVSAFGLTRAWTRVGTQENVSDGVQIRYRKVHD